MGRPNSLQLYMIFTHYHNMMVSHAHHLATNSQGQGGGQGHKFGKTSFSECGHVAYQIKGNEMFNNKQANILTLCTTSSPGVGSKQLFRVLMVHHTMTNSATHIIPSYHGTNHITYSPPHYILPNHTHT